MVISPNPSSSSQLSPPQSPSNKGITINEEFLDPKFYNQFTDESFVKSINSPLPKSLSKYRNRYSSEQEAREAKLKRDRENQRSKRLRMKSLPDNDPEKIDYISRQSGYQKKYRFNKLKEDERFFKNRRRRQREKSRNPNEATKQQVQNKDPGLTNQT